MNLHLYSFFALFTLIPLYAIAIYFFSVRNTSTVYSKLYFTKSIAFLRFLYPYAFLPSHKKTSCPNHYSLSRRLIIYLCFRSLYIKDILLIGYSSLWGYVLGTLDLPFFLKRNHQSQSLYTCIQALDLRTTRTAPYQRRFVPHNSQ